MEASSAIIKTTKSVDKCVTKHNCDNTDYINSKNRMMDEIIQTLKNKKENVQTIKVKYNRKPEFIARNQCVVNNCKNKIKKQIDAVNYSCKFTPTSIYCKSKFAKLENKYIDLENYNIFLSLT